MDLNADYECYDGLGLTECRLPAPGEIDAYERVLGDAMAGDATLFACEDYVEEDWRIVDPALKASTPVFQYEPKTWGPAEVERQVSPPGGWVNPVFEISGPLQRPRARKKELVGNGVSSK